MRFVSTVVSGLKSFCLLGTFFAFNFCHAQSNVTIRVMSANLTSGTHQSYETAGIDIFQGLKPDIVAIQEFRYNSSSDSNSLRTFVDTAFGTNFYFFCQSGFNIPNGVVSRYPIIASGSWTDSLVSDRSFVWAQIDLPGSNDLYVVSVHLYSGGTATDRNTEAMEVKTNIQTHFPTNAWVIVAGDFNTGNRSEAGVDTFKTFLSDSPIPDDGGNSAHSTPDQDTNEPRNKPYDYVLPSFSLANYQVPSNIGSRTFTNGLVFDSAVYWPLSDVSPVASGDSHVEGMQHMAVIKDFSISASGTSVNNTAPTINTQPQNLTVSPGNSATFSVTASGTSPLYYQWFFNNTNIIGATNNSYSLTNVQLTNAGNYSVIVSNFVGSITSAPASLTVVSNVASTSTNIVAQWNFNSTIPDAAVNTGVTNPSVGSGTASLYGGTTATFATGDTTLDLAGSTDNSGWNTANYPAQGSGNKTRGAQFNVSTAGKQSIAVSWSSQGSDSGSKYGRLQYSTNGTDFMDFPAAFTNGTSFTAKTNSLAGISGVNDNANFAIRFVAEFESTATGNTNANYVAANPSKSYATGGTMRFDMVTIYGSPLITNAPPALPPTIGLPVFAAGQFQIPITGTAGSNYVMQVSTNLALNDWISLSTNAAPFTFTDTNLNAPQKFYRVIVAP